MVAGVTNKQCYIIGYGYCPQIQTLPSFLGLNLELKRETWMKILF